MVLIKFHIGCDFFCGINDVICFAPHKYIENMVLTYMTMFVLNPNLNKTFRSPLEQGGRPEIYTS